jgi:hypothetical protein
MLSIPVVPFFSTSLQLQAISRKPRTSINQFATVGYPTTAQILISTNLQLQTILQKLRTSINWFTDQRLLYKSLEYQSIGLQTADYFTKAWKPQSDRYGSVRLQYNSRKSVIRFYIFVPTTIYFLLYIYVFNYNYILFIRFYTPYPTILYTFFGLASSMLPAPNFGVYRRDIEDIGRNDCKEQLGQHLEAVPCRRAVLLGELPF